MMLEHRTCRNEVTWYIMPTRTMERNCTLTFILIMLVTIEGVILVILRQLALSAWLVHELSFHILVYNALTPIVAVGEKVGGS